MIGPIALRQLTDEQLQNKIDELQRLFNAKLPVGIPTGQALEDMRR